MNPTASSNLFKPLPTLREPISGPKSQKNVKKGLKGLQGLKGLKGLKGQLSKSAHLPDPTHPGTKYPRSGEPLTPIYTDKAN